MSACQKTERVHILRVEQLETAPVTRPVEALHAVVSDTRAFRDLCEELCTRLSLLEIRDAGQWNALRAFMPALGSSPDFSEGIVVGLTSRAGIPLDGRWPIDIGSVHVRDGAGLVDARFASGTYLPDGTTFVSLAQVPGLESVLVVDVNDVRFYPDDLSNSAH